MTPAARASSRSAHIVGLVLTALGAILIAVAVAPGEWWTASAPTATAVDPAGRPAGSAAASGPPQPPPRLSAGVGPPRTVLIPALGVVAELDRLGLRPDGALAAPHDFRRAGWYADGPEPGEPGAAVVVGHVDSRNGPAAFYRLHELQPGQLVMIQGANGVTTRFEVERVEQHAKWRFPTDEVYTPTAAPTLRLITCGGTFDRRVASYRDNVIVYARLAG